jgi:poly-D-alanine transfer protein DltD
MKFEYLPVLLIFFFSCSDKDLPKDIIPQNKMHVILWDMMRADELVSYQSEKDTSLNKFTRSIELYQQILQVHNTKPKDFKRSVQYYQGHPEQLKPIFDSLQKKASTVSIPATTAQ